MWDHLRQVSAGFVESASSLTLLVNCEISVAANGQTLADRVGYNCRFDDVLRSRCSIGGSGVVGLEVYHHAARNQLHRSVVSSPDQSALS